MPTRVAVGLGSNLGDRAENLRTALEALSGILVELRTSPVYESEPVHVPDQPKFLNAVATGRTRLTARQLLSELQDAERRVGRRPGPRYGPRIVDLDLLLYGQQRIVDPDLVVPHPRISERAFVLVPLRDIAANWGVPVSDNESRPVAELADAIDILGLVPTDIDLGR